MGITTRFVRLIILGLLLTIAAWIIDLHVFIFVFWNIFMLGLLSLDAIITPSTNVLHVHRGDGDKLFFKAENIIEFYVKNNSMMALSIQATDESLRHFNVIAQDLLHEVEPGKEQIFSYTVIPGKRGSFDVSKIFIRFYGILGLCMKYETVNCPTTHKVYPNIKDLSKYRLMMQKNRFLPKGDKNLRQYGAGAEFESLRPYVEGDDYRKINWTATARENKIIINQYQIERDQPVYILLDTSRPMSYTVNGFKKLDFAINAALILCDIVNQAGDKAGILVFDSEVKVNITPGQGAMHRNNIMETLYHVSDNRQTANYYGAFRELCERQKRRSLVFIFTDFEILEEAEDLISHIALLKRRHMPIVVFMKNESLDALANTQQVKREYDKVLKDTANEFVDERRKIIRTLNMMGIPSIESKAEDFALNAVNRYLQAVK